MFAIPLPHIVAYDACMHIAVVEDERKLAGTLKEGLEAEGYTVETFADGESASLGLSKSPYDVVLLDLMLPKKNGIEVCRSARSEGIMTPILMLTARDSVDDKVEALDAGADDFVTKPFSFDELLARVRALSRRARADTVSASVYTAGDLLLDSTTYKVTRAGKRVSLTLKEFELLRYLLEHKGEAKTREDIFKHVWQRDDTDFGNVVDVHVRHVREKIDDQHDTKIIRTIRGVGYAAEE